MFDYFQKKKKKGQISDFLQNENKFYYLFILKLKLLTQHRLYANL